MGALGVTTPHRRVFLHLGRVPAWSGPPPLGRSLAEGYHLQEDGPADGAGSPLLPRIPLPASLQPTPLPPPSSVPMPESIFAALGKPLNVDGAQGRMGAHLCLVCLLTSMHMHRLDHPPQHRGDEVLDHAKRHGRFRPSPFGRSTPRTRAQPA